METAARLSAVGMESFLKIITAGSGVYTTTVFLWLLTIEAQEVKNVKTQRIIALSSMEVSFQSQNVRQLFLYFFQIFFHHHNNLLYSGIVGFGAQRVDFAPDFLRYERQLFAG